MYTPLAKPLVEVIDAVLDAENIAELLGKGASEGPKRRVVSSQRECIVVSSPAGHTIGGAGHWASSRDQVPRRSCCGTY